MAKPWEYLMRRRATTNGNGGGSTSDGDAAHINCGMKFKFSASNYMGLGGFVIDGHILCDILSRLPVKSLMRFKSVSKQWRWMIEQDKRFIVLHNTRSEARQYSNDTRTTTLLITPVAKFFGTCSTSIATQEIKMLMFDGSVCHPISSTKAPVELILFGSVSILDPVYGLVCFVNHYHYGSVLIYNPCTREKTSWIKTKTSVLLKHKEPKSHSSKTFSSCMFGFGYDTTAKEHKVLCIYQLDIEVANNASIGNGYKCPVYDKYRKIKCEVMTVGKNIWREIDHDNIIPLNMWFGPQCKTVHVNGFIYWMCYQNAPYSAIRNYFIMKFDVRRETFGVIFIPACILDDLWRLNCLDRTRKWTNELIEVDGRIAILDIEGDQCREGERCRDRHQCTQGDQWINLWIYNEDNKINSIANTGYESGTCSGSNYWTKETVPMAYRWEELNYIAFSAITGTDLIITKYFPKSPSPATKVEYLNCYDRKQKKSYEVHADMVMDHACHFDMTTCSETLAPVQVKLR